MSRNSRRQATGIQLFPFLAVLICTMGALIVLLVLMVQHTRVDAKTKAAALLAEQQKKSAQDEERLRREREAFEDAQWRAEMLVQQREETAKEFTDQRLRLSHLEDHIRRLREQAQQLIDRAMAIDKGQANQDQNLAAIRAQLDDLQKQIAEKQKELDEAKKQKSQEQWFALIAYEGPNGTRRRPIYLECTGRGVILQPEGILFNPDDFSGPMTAGNPLDSALRATREYLVKAGSLDHGEPYPLLVVRPSGIIAYGAARAAMKSWDQEFGYELVAEDKQLTFGSPDPALQQVLGKTVAAARQRQAVMMAAMPRHYEKGETLTSFAPEDQPEYRQAVASSGRGFGGGSDGNGSGIGGDMPVNSLARGGGGAGGRGDMPVRGSAPPADQLAMGGSGGSPAGGSGGGHGTGMGSGAGGPSSGGPALGNPNGNGGSFASGGGSAAGASSPGAASGAAGGMNSISMGNAAAGGGPAGSAANQDASVTGGNGSGRNPGQPGASPPPTSQARGGGSPVRGGSSRSGGSQGGSSSGSAGGHAGKGSNWGLPESRIHSTAVTRPIRVVVLRDRIIILPEQGEDRAAQTIMISPQLTFSEVDRFVEAVQRHMQSWGLAVANGYWKPILRIEVAPDAEQVFADLQLGIEDSGFEVQRKVE